MKPTLITIIAASMLFTGCICHQDLSHTPDSTNVISSFKQLRDAGHLAGLAADEHGELTTFKVMPHHRQESWFRSFAAPATDCPSVHLVDVKIGGRSLRYLFCADTSPAKLLGAFSLENQKWHPIQ
jgi:hypothetical protein